MTRMLSSEARIDNSAFRTGKLSAEEWVRLASAADVLSRSNIYIDDTSGITVQEIKARLRRMKNLGLVVIDYLQLMTNGGKRGGDGNRVQEVSDMTRNLKIMAKDLDVPVITLSQLSRSPDSRTDHRPMPVSYTHLQAKFDQRIAENAGIGSPSVLVLPVKMLDHRTGKFFLCIDDMQCDSQRIRSFLCC